MKDDPAFIARNLFPEVHAAPDQRRPRLHAIVQFAAGLWAVGFLLYMLPATLIEQNWLGSAGLAVGFGLILAAIWGDRW